MSSLNAAVEDLAPSSSPRSRPIRWIFFTFVRFFFERGRRSLTFQAFFVQGPLFFLIFLFFIFNCLANILFFRTCCNKLEVTGTEREDHLVWDTFLLSNRICFG